MRHGRIGKSGRSVLRPVVQECRHVREHACMDVNVPASLRRSSSALALRLVHSGRLGVHGRLATKTAVLVEGRDVVTAFLLKDTLLKAARGTARRLHHVIRNRAVSGPCGTAGVDAIAIVVEGG